jgi:galactokinase
LRDFNCQNLNIPLEWLYKLLLALPEKATRAELEAMLPDADLTVFWDNHAEPADGIYPIRGTVIYGLAECARSARFVEYLASDIKQAGEMMNISHNGDRVHCFDPQGNSLGEYFFDTSDKTITQWINDLRSGDPERIERAQLWRQPGSYQCSLPDIDLMVDLACGVPGVVGAQLAGAGLGGCMMILVHKNSIGELTRVLTEKYYQPRNLTPRLLHCRPIAGAGSIKWD